MTTYSKPRLNRLLKILELKRPSLSATEKQFAEEWLPKIINSMGFETKHDKYGNLWTHIKHADGTNPVTMFSSHTDTVHSNDGKQTLAYDGAKFHLFTDDKNTNCLGADDGTGVWLMLHMIENQIPGLYCFHRDEECGGGGSSFSAANNAALLEGIKHCVAFDRAGYKDIITHQGGTQTCSEHFATELAKHLPGFEKCDRGVFTDSKNYRKLIPECTNLSVGYFQQHGKTEHQDVRFAVQLANSLCKIPWHTLPATRDPKAEPPPRWGNDDGFFELYGGSYGTGFHSKNSSYTKTYERPVKLSQLKQWVANNPLAAAHLLSDFEVTDFDLAAGESSAKRERDRAMVVQRSKPVREMPLGSEKEVPRQTANKKQRGTGPRTDAAQSGRTVHNTPKQRPATTPVVFPDPTEPPA